MKFGPIRKAILSALVTGSAALAVAGADQSVTLAEALFVAAATIASGAAVYGVKNVNA